jgi:hypothetical protein
MLSGFLAFMSCTKEYGRKLTFTLDILHIVTIESVGSIEPQDLFVQAVQVLVDKCAQVKRALQATLHAE